jgi:hypothetical protein
MNEPQAWRHIARKIERGRWFRSGLCWEVITLYDRGYIEYEMRDRMRDRVKAHMPVSQAYFDSRGNGPWLVEPGEAGPRILAAYFLAHEAEDEAQ